MDAAKRRLGLADLSVYVEEARQDLASETGADWIVLLLGRPLPSTMRHWVRVRIGVNLESSGIIETRVAPNWLCEEGSGVDELWGPVRGIVVDTRDLNAEECRPLLSLLENAQPEDLAQVLEDRRVLDGYDCHVLVFRRSPGLSTHVHFNLSNVRAEQLLEQVCVKLARMMLSLRSRMEEHAE